MTQQQANDQAQESQEERYVAAVASVTALRSMSEQQGIALIRQAVELEELRARVKHLRESLTAIDAKLARAIETEIAVEEDELSRPRHGLRAVDEEC